MTPRRRKSRRWKHASGRKIFVPPALDQKNELDRAAAMLSALDILVSAPTAVSWLAAGAGTRTLKLLYDTSWTAFGQSYEPLAPSCHCVMPDSSRRLARGFRASGGAYRRDPERRRFLPSKRPRQIGGDPRGAIAVKRASPAMRISRRRAGIVHQRLHGRQDIFVARPPAPRPSETPMPAASKAQAERA